MGKVFNHACNNYYDYFDNEKVRITLNKISKTSIMTVEGGDDIANVVTYEHIHIAFCPFCGENLLNLLNESEE